jgi:hypothetical protein
MAEKSDSQVVKDVGKWEWSELWKKEDWWAIWLGFFILLAGVVLYFPQSGAMKSKLMDAEAKYSQAAQRTDQFKTIAWYQLYDAKKKVKAKDIPAGKFMSTFSKKTHGWTTNPLDAFFMSKEKADAKKAKAMVKYDKAKASAAEALAMATAAEAAAEAAGFSDAALNGQAKASIGAWRDAHLAASNAKKKTSAKPYNQIGMKQYGIGYAAWAIFIGMLIANTVGTPKWALEACQTEYFIKTGLVLLGAEILFGKILSIGIPGIFVAWVVTPIVLISTYLFGQKVLKMTSKTLNITISADMSVCGVSAAIATAAACRAKKEELTLAVGLSLVFTSIMMIVMPMVIKFFGMPEVLGGAWMGGTIDATGAVAAAGAFLGEKALYTAATIKMIQNVLIGVIAFCVARVGHQFPGAQGAPGGRQAVHPLCGRAVIQPVPDPDGSLYYVLRGLPRVDRYDLNDI